MDKESLISESAKKVYVKDDNIVINVAYEYNIEKHRCDTAEKILAWVQQLSDKTWMSCEVMGIFIAVACKENGIDLRLP